MGMRTLTKCILGVAAAAALGVSTPGTAGLVITGNIDGDGSLVAVAGQANVFSLGFEGPLIADALTVELVLASISVSEPLRSFGGSISPPAIEVVYGVPSGLGLGPWTWLARDGDPYVSADGFSFTVPPGVTLDLLRGTLILPDDTPAGSATFVLRYEIDGVDIEPFEDLREFTLNVVAIPEPSGIALVLAGVGIMGLIARRRSARA